MADRRPTVMDETRLTELLDAYGADAERWPADERAAALALLARSAEAQALLAAARGLDALLALDPAATPSPALAERIVAAAARTRPPAVQRGPGRARRYLAAIPIAAAAALALWMMRTPDRPSPEPAQVATDAGSYGAPGDALLAISDLGLPDADVWGGCPEQVLGCLDLEALDLDSLSATPRRRIVS
jgi:hypothetical protein